jgi:4-hydroxybenzoate polyprenyltransferase
LTHNSSERLPQNTSVFKGLILSLRPRQWPKNVLIFFGLIFSLNFFNIKMDLLALAAFVLFCLLSSAVYLINDSVDYDRDREHPTKRNRPIAAGIVSRQLAIITAVVLLVVSIGGSFVINIPFGLMSVVYLLMNLAYSFGLKHVVIIDVFVLAAGFVLRAVAGALAINVPISPWLYVCTVLGALFLALGKRRHELILLSEDASKHRRILEEYSPAMLDQMITIVTATALMAYSLYTFTAENLPRNHSMMITIPFVLFGIFRYLYLIHKKHLGGSPEEVFLTDAPLVVDMVAWVLASAIIMYFFRGF